MRILAIDYGKKRIGLAVSDPLRIVTTALETISWNGTNLETVFASLQKNLDEYNFTEIVIGLPLNMDGTEGKMVEEVREFGDRLQEHFKLTVHTIDERLTTMRAEKDLNTDKKYRKKRKSLVDSVSAQLILQGYLRSLDSGTTHTNTDVEP